MSRMSFVDPVRLTVLYSSCTVEMIVERESYQKLYEVVTSVDVPVWVRIGGMVNDFDANKIEVSIRTESIVSIECTEVNS